MRKKEYDSERLVEFFCNKKVLTLKEIQDVLGTLSRMTAFRKLKDLNCHTSYSHAGRYYTLPEIPRYDEYGLWHFNMIHFSRYGTLVNAIDALVRNSEAGYFASELEKLLQVGVRNAVGKMYASGRLLREQIGNEYIYLAPQLAESQLSKRKVLAQKRFRSNFPESELTEEEFEGHLRIFLSVLNEKQRRLYLGFESLKLGRGGDGRIALLAGANVKTVARGRRELLSKNITMERIRREGAGRSPLKKRRS
jgi:hypothetical protein